MSSKIEVSNLTRQLESFKNDTKTSNKLELEIALIDEVEESAITTVTVRFNKNEVKYDLSADSINREDIKNTILAFVKSAEDITLKLTYKEVVYSGFWWKTHYELEATIEMLKCVKDETVIALAKS